MTAIDDLYTSLGGEAVFGPAYGPETPTPDGRGTTRDYVGCSIWWSPDTGAHQVQGLILACYRELGGPGYLGFPLTDETVGGDGTGRLSTFELGWIAWSPAGGAWEVYGAIGGLWRSRGAETGLGYPLSAEQAHADGIGRTQWFGGGQLYWSPATGAIVLGGGGGGSLVDLLAAFGAGSAGSPWHGLSRRDVATRLGELLVDPDLVRQGNLNLCGPAVFVRSWIRRDPVGFVNFAVELYDTGQSRIGNDYKVAPDEDACLATDYAGLRSTYGASLAPSAEWMAMCAIRDAENALFDYEGRPDEDASAMTTPGELVEWLEACGRYGQVEDETNLYLTKGLGHAQGLQPGPDQLVAVLLNTAMLTNEDGSVENFILAQFPNHWVTLESPVVLTPSGVQLTYWCFGRTAPYRTVVVPVDVFEANYYGAVVAR